MISWIYVETGKYPSSKNTKIMMYVIEYWENNPTEIFDKKIYTGFYVRKHRTLKKGFHSDYALDHDKNLTFIECKTRKVIAWAPLTKSTPKDFYFFHEI